MTMRSPMVVVGRIVRPSLMTWPLIFAMAGGMHLSRADEKGPLPTSADSPVRTPPLLISTSCRKPEYPLGSLNASEAGAVLLKFLVDDKGNVTESVVERSSGYQRLDEAARAALRMCKFKPATLDGNPTIAWAPIEYVWTLKEAQSLQTKPKLIANSCKKPPYPRTSLDNGEAGVVLLRFLVDSEGKVAESAVARSSGYLRLDEAARTALELCKFEPALLDGKPTSAWFAMEYVWAIENPDVDAVINTPPRLVISSCQKPQYPAEAHASGESGSVELKFVVNGTGEVVESKVVRSSGHERLDTAARSALERCRFEPAIRGGRSTMGSLQLEYEWSLAGPGGVRTQPFILADSCDKPAYPQVSRRMNESGTVTLKFFIDEMGTVAYREIERSSGYKRLDNAAAAGLSLCKFRPATFDGKPTGAWTRIEYVWRLQ